MSRFLCPLIAALCASPRAQEEDFSLEVAALIEKTNALESFHLVYELEGESEGERVAETIELIYRAPDLGRIRKSGPDGDSDLWIIGGRAHSELDGKWTTAVLEPDDVTALLDETFPEATVLGPGLSVILDLRRWGEHGAFSLGFSHSDTGRSCVLGWLSNLQAWSGVTADDSWLTWEGDRLECKVSRETGILEAVALSSETGEMTARLQEHRLDEVLDPELVTLPPDAREADDDPELSHALDKNPLRLREDAFLRVEQQLGSDKRRWNESTQEDWRSILDAMYRESIPLTYSDWLEELLEYTDEIAAWAETTLAEDDSDEVLEETEKHVAGRRDELLLGFEQALEQLFDALPAFETEVQPREELLDMERSVLVSLWEEMVSDPILEAFDEKTEAALKR